MLFRSLAIDRKKVVELVLRGGQEAAERLVPAAVRTGEDVFQVAIIVRAIDRQRCFMPYPYVGVATPGTQ